MNPFANSPFASDLGVEVLEWSAGKAVVALELVDRLRNRRGVAHGGVTATLFDLALGLASRSPTGEWVSEGTVTLNVQYLLPGRGRLLAEGRLLKVGNTLAFADGEVRDENGIIIAKATATYKIRRQKTGAKKRQDSDG